MKILFKTKTIATKVIEFEKKIQFPPPLQSFQKFWKDKTHSWSWHFADIMYLLSKL